MIIRPDVFTGKIDPHLMPSSCCKLEQCRIYTSRPAPAVLVVLSGSARPVLTPGLMRCLGNCPNLCCAGTELSQLIFVLFLPAAP